MSDDQHHAIVEAPTQDTAPRRPEFVLIIQDSVNPGEVNLGGAQYPAEFDPKSPAHVIGRFFQQNMELLLEIARSQAAGPKPILNLLAPSQEVIGEREKTIILPDQAVVR